jgi:hypothetical protein
LQLDLTMSEDFQNLKVDNDNAAVAISHVYMPRLSSGDGSCRLYQWLVGDCWNVEEGQPIAKVLRLDLDSTEVILAPKSGRINHVARPLENLKVGQIVASIEAMRVLDDHGTSTGKVRIYELSRDLSLDNKDVLDAAEQLGISAKSNSSSIGEDDAFRIRSLIKRDRNGNTSGPQTNPSVGNSQSSITSSCYPMHTPFNLSGSGYQIEAWLVNDGTWVTKDEPIVKLRNPGSGGESLTMKARDCGFLRHIKCVNEIVPGVALIGIIDVSKAAMQVSSAASVLSKKQTTYESLRHGSINARAGEIPRFCPSVASEPLGFGAQESCERDLQYSFASHQNSYQSFFNDLAIVDSSGISDDVMSISCFDEALYCALVREMHRYSLAEIADNKTELASKNAGLGAMVGSLLGLISGNIFAPFLGHSYGKNISNNGRRVDEFLPDPNLLFYQDENSYLSWSKAQVTSPRLRRLIFDRRVKADGNVFFRLIPAIVTADSVFPVQLFKIDSSTYFYRPFSAGIERNQPHYDSVKIQKRYFHLRGEGVVSETDMKVCISGRDVEEYESKIFRFQGSSLDYFYLDFKTSPGSVF